MAVRQDNDFAVRFDQPDLLKRPGPAEERGGLEIYVQLVPRGECASVWFFQRQATNRKRQNQRVKSYLLNCGMAFGRDRQLFEQLPLDQLRQSKKTEQNINDKNSECPQQAFVPGGT